MPFLLGLSGCFNLTHAEQSLQTALLGIIKRDLPVFDDEQSIDELKNASAVCCNDYGTPLAPFGELLNEMTFGCFVHRRSRLIKQHDRGIADQQARQ